MTHYSETQCLPTYALLFETWLDIIIPAIEREIIIKHYLFYSDCGENPVNEDLPHYRVGEAGSRLPTKEPSTIIEGQEEGQWRDHYPTFPAWAALITPAVSQTTLLCGQPALIVVPSQPIIELDRLPTPPRPPPSPNPSWWWLWPACGSGQENPAVSWLAGHGMPDWQPARPHPTALPTPYPTG